MGGNGRLSPFLLGQTVPFQGRFLLNFGGVLRVHFGNKPIMVGFPNVGVLIEDRGVSDVKFQFLGQKWGWSSSPSGLGDHFNVKVVFVFKNGENWRNMTKTPSQNLPQKLLKKTHTKKEVQGVAVILTL